MKRFLATAAALAIIIGHGVTRPEPVGPGPQDIIISIRLDSGECITGPLIQDGPGHWVPME